MTIVIILKTAYLYFSSTNKKVIGKLRPLACLLWNLSGSEVRCTLM